MRTLLPMIALLLAPVFTSALDKAELDKKALEVERLRGQTFVGAVEHRVLARAELRGFLEKQVENQLSMNIESYMAVLEALWLVDPDTSISSLLDLYDAQVLAFYDPLGHVYYSLDEPPKGIVMSEVMIDAVVVHELVHALQDQRFSVGDTSVRLQSNWDAAMAFQAVLEGEALLVMMGWLGEMTGMTLEDLVAQEEFVSSIREATAAGTNVPDDVPGYFVESLQFPYVDGLMFIVDLFRRGGWSAIDSMYDDLPATTEELKHPEIYQQRVESARSLLQPALSESSDRIVETVMGEFHWAFLLGEDAGRGWASDVVSVRLSDQGATVLVDTTWDEESDAVEFEAAYQSFLDEHQTKNLVVVRQGSRVKAAYGADEGSIKVFTGRQKPGADRQ